MEILCLVFLDVVEMVGLLNVIAPFLLDNLMTLVIEHSFLCYSIDSIAIFVGLLLLRYGFAIPVFPCRILEVTLFVQLSVRANC